MKKNNFLVLGMLAMVSALAFVVVGCASLSGDDGGYSIGDTGPAGGIIFYVKEKASDGWQYLEAAPVDLDGTYMWASSEYMDIWLEREDVDNDKAIGMGKANTVAILAHDSNAPAAKACADYVSGGKDDWFLPSEDELYEMYKLRATIGGFADVSYWASSNNGDGVRFSTGEHPWYDSKAYNLRVRAIRSF